MDYNRSDCLHYDVCEEWKTLGNENYINESDRKCDFYKQRQKPMLDKMSEEEQEKWLISAACPSNNWGNMNTYAFISHCVFYLVAYKGILSYVGHGPNWGFVGNLILY